MSQEKRIDEIACQYPGVRVTENIGPSQDRAVVACPDGRMVVIGPDGAVLADSVEQEYPPATMHGYDPAVDALLVETCDGEWLLLPPWRCAMSAKEHLPLEHAEALLEELRGWGSNHSLLLGLRVWKLARGTDRLKGPLFRREGGWK